MTRTSKAGVLRSTPWVLSRNDNQERISVTLTPHGVNFDSFPVSILCDNTYGVNLNTPVFAVWACWRLLVAIYFKYGGRK